MWNYRIFTKEINGRQYYSLKEAYYDENGKITSFTENTITGYFEDLEDLENSHNRMNEDIQRFKNKVLVEESFDFLDAGTSEGDQRPLASLKLDMGDAMWEEVLDGDDGE